MGYSTTCVDKVKATAFALGRRRDGQMVPLPGVILLNWRSSETQKQFQAYVDGELAGVTIHPHQRTLLVQYAHTHPVVIEVIAVDPDDRDKDFSEVLSGFSNRDGCHVVLRWPRRGSLPLDTEVQVYWNNGSGAIDYDTEPLLTRKVWDKPTEKWGWGFDAFGVGDFGYSGTGAPGWGRGSFAEGEFGFDAEYFKLRTDALPLGTYLFGVRLSDDMGNLDGGDIDELSLSVDPIPRAPQLEIDSYDKDTATLVLRIT